MKIVFVNDETPRLNRMAGLRNVSRFRASERRPAILRFVAKTMLAGGTHKTTELRRLHMWNSFPVIADRDHRSACWFKNAAPNQQLAQTIITATQSKPPHKKLGIADDHHTSHALREIIQRLTITVFRILNSFFYNSICMNFPAHGGTRRQRISTDETSARFVSVSHPVAAAMQRPRDINYRVPAFIQLRNELCKAHTNASDLDWNQFEKQTIGENNL